MKLPPGLSVSEAIDRYRRQAEVLYAEPNYPIYPTATPMDPSFGLQWALNNTGQVVNGQAGTADADIDAPEAWDITTGNSTVVIAVIDTGIDLSHPDLVPNMVQLENNCADGLNNDGNTMIVNGQPFQLIDDCRGIDVVGGLNPPGGLPPQGFYNNPIDNDNEPPGPGSEDGVRHHGTRTAGIIGAKGDNTQGIAGVNWNVKLLTCKAIAPGANFNSTVADAIQCLDYVIATKNAPNVNPSLKFVATNNSWTLGSGFSQSLFDAIKVQRDNGLLFIVAADNAVGGTGTDNDVAPVFPASYYLENIIAVAATNSSDSKATFSNFGRRTVHLGAPGQNILSTVRVNPPGPTADATCLINESYCFGSGTSFAAPQVSGVAALLKAKILMDGPASPTDWIKIKNLILAGGDDNSSLATTTITGKRLNAHRALTCSNSVVAKRLQPVPSALTALLDVTQIHLAALNINCATPNGNDVAVPVKNQAGQTIQTVTLLDNGVAPDQVAGDGIFSAFFVPQTAEQLTLTFPGNDVVTVRVIQRYNFTTATFQYRNITGTSLNLGDEGSSQIASPFPVLFGGLTFNTLFVSPNGNLNFVGPLGGFVNGHLPPAGEELPLETLVAPFWADLEPVQTNPPGNNNNVFWQELNPGPSGGRELVIEWRNVPYFDCPSETVKFQVVLFANTSDILFNYADTALGGSCSSANNGALATVGIQVAPNAATQFSFNTASLSDNMTLRWTVQGNPGPTLNSISPTSTVVGDPGNQNFTLTVNGSNFVPASKVRWNGVDRTTTFAHSGQLTAAIPASDLAVAGTAQVTVFNPAPGGGTSAGRTFTIVNPPPVLGSISDGVDDPTSTTAGGGAFTLTVNGSGFVSTSKVRWNGADRTTMFVSGNQLTATIPSSDLIVGAIVQVTVFNPSPGGGTSGAQTFTINNPVPVLSSISDGAGDPTSTTAGGGQFTLDVNGSSFVSTSVVRWNGNSRPTTFINNTLLRAQIPASDIATGGTAAVRVFSPTPGGGQSAAELIYTINNPVPTLDVNGLVPDNTLAGGAQFALTVNGSNFVNSPDPAKRSVVRWNGSDRATTFVTSTQLTATISMADIAAAGVVPITVFNPAPGGGTSDPPRTFTVNNPLPVLTTLSPAGATAGGGQFPLTVNGSNFVNGSVVRWNGANRTTTFVESGQLTATISAADIADGGTATVTVFTPLPGGGLSGGQTFTINNPAPVLSSISDGAGDPASTTAGGAGFTLTVNGTGFVPSSVVRWNGASRTTSFVNGTQVTATIPAADIATAGTATVTVVNGAPGGGTSAGQTFTINNPLPALTSISDGVDDLTSTTAGGAQFTLTVNGSNFVNDADPLKRSVVRWNGSDRATAFVNSGQLTATILMADIATAGIATVTVFNPAPGGGTSGGQAYTINNPVPTLSSISDGVGDPTSTTAGGAGFPLTLNGSNFVSTSVVRWNCSDSSCDRATTFVNSGQLTATIPASDIATAGTATVTVFNPTPGGGPTVASATFTINNPIPALNSMSPGSALTTDPQFTLTVNGSNFVNDLDPSKRSVVRWNCGDSSCNRPTTFVNSSQVTATIPVTDLMSAGTVQVTVFNPAPGGGTSPTSLPFTISAPPPVVLSSLSPNSAVAAGTGFTLTVMGENFDNGTPVVRWNCGNSSCDRQTTVLGPTMAEAIIPASDIAVAGTAEVTVHKPEASPPTSNSRTFTINNPAPDVTTIAPTNKVVGEAQFDLTVTGSGFVNGSVVQWNGSNRVTMFNSPTQLMATIPASDLAVAGTAQVAVLTPAPGGGVSAARTFTINNPMPAVTSISPSSGPAGGAGFTLTVTGSNFVNGSIVRWSGGDRVTTFISGSQLQATIPASDVELGGIATVTVFNPGPGGGTSVSGQPFSINNPVPTLASIAPTSALAGGGQFTLTLTGSSFVPGSVVQWNGTNRTTPFVDSGQLTASIPAADIASGGTASVTVFNPAPAGGVSGPQTLTINNPVPTLSSISDGVGDPTSTTAGGAGFSLTVNGSGFVDGSVVRWNGSNRATVFNAMNPTQLTATISAADIASGSLASVTVFNPAPGGGTTGAQTFTVNNPNPSITSVVSNPNPIPVGAAGATLTVNGAGFVPSSVVRWGGSNRTTTFVSGGLLTATIPASDLVNAGTPAITVFSPTPGGGTSPGQNVTVASPAIASLSPNNIPATSPQFMLTVNGSNFHSASVVRWKGSDRATVFNPMNPTQLTATILASDVLNSGLAQVTVFNSPGAGGVSDPSTFTIANRNPLPTVTGLMPSGVTSGGPAFTLMVFGSNFVGSSVVRWNCGTSACNRPTMFVSSMELWADIPASDITNPGSASITVSTPSPGGGTSNPKSLPIQNMGNPVPVIASLGQNSIVAGTVRDVLMVQVNGLGSSFVAGSVVRWNGANRLTTFSNANQLTVTIPASDLVSAGTATVTVFNPAPGGGTSNSQTFMINNAAPILSAITPTTAVAGSPGFTMTVVGANFVPGSVVRWNCMDSSCNRSTTFIGNNQLRAAIPASDVSAAGSALVTVVTPGPGGGTSAPLMFTVSSSFLEGSTQNSNPGTTSAVVTDGASAPEGTSGGAAARASETGSAGTVVRNSGDGAQSLQRPMGVLVAGPGLVPVVSGAEVSRSAAGNREVSVKVRGMNFLRGAVVRWNGKDLHTTYLGSGELQAVVPSTLAIAGDNGNITVINPEPNGLESFPFELVLR